MLQLVSSILFPSFVNGVEIAEIDDDVVKSIWGKTNPNMKRGDQVISDFWNYSLDCDNFQ